jgi:hypothetical protein
MKALLGKLLCILFLHDFYTAEETEEYTAVRCPRCWRAWRVDSKRRTMEAMWNLKTRSSVLTLLEGVMS